MAKERVEVFCAGGVAVLDDFRSLLTVKDGKRTEERGAQDKGWRGEWLAFASAIQESGQPPIPYAQLLGVTRAMFGVMESIRGGSSIQLI